MASQDDASPLAKYDPAVLKGIDAQASGQLGAPRTTFLPTNFGEAMELAKIMAAGTFVPDRMRGKPGDCLAVLMQASRWGMDPFAVAQKVYFVNANGIPGYEAQLVAAVINSSGAIDGSLDVEWMGEGDKLVCEVSGKRRGETKLKSVRQELATITTKNSPLWKQSPRQQLGYYTQRLWVRLYAPEVLLGVYTADEIEDMGPDNARPVGPAAPSRASVSSAKVERIIAGRTPEQQADIDEAEAQAARDARGMTEVDEDAARKLDAGEVVEGQFEKIADGLQDAVDYANGDETKGREAKPSPIVWDSWLTKFERKIDSLTNPTEVEEHYESKRERLEAEAPDGIRNRAKALADARVRQLLESVENEAEKPAPRKRTTKPKEPAPEAPPADQEEPEPEQVAASAAEPVEEARADEIIGLFNKCEVLMDVRRKKLEFDEEIDAMSEANAARVSRAFKAVEDKLKGPR